MTSLPQLLSSPQLLAALAAFAFVSSITPGPNNAMLMASGANFGFASTLPHLAGVTIGFAILLLSVGLGLGGLFTAVPALHAVLKAVGAAYLLWLAWKIATAKGVSGKDGGGRPISFLQAVGFQWVNPKAWVMSVGAVAAYVPQGEGLLPNVALVVLVFSLVNLPCIVAWAGGGVALRRLLAQPAALRAFNWIMAALLVGSLIPIVLDLAGGWRA